MSGGDKNKKLREKAKEKAAKQKVTATKGAKQRISKRKAAKRGIVKRKGASRKKS